MADPSSEAKTSDPTNEASSGSGGVDETKGSDEKSLSSISGPKVKYNLPGTPAADCFRWPAAGEEKLEDMGGQFATQEYIQHLIRKDPADLASICRLPTSCDKSVWVMEHLRIFLAQLNHLLVLMADHCTAETCPIMIATKDWEFLCAAVAHGKKPRHCCAIDYTLHTLGHFSALLNSDEFPPQRQKVPPKSTAHFASIARRLYRIFAHPYYHHREIFDLFESETHLCKRFMNFTVKFGLMTKAEFTPPMAPA